MATITIGPPVRGDDFFDRESLLDLLWNAVEKGSVLLAAPRRVGKTSLMLHMLYNPRNEYVNRVFYLEAEAFSCPEELVAEMVIHATKALPKMRQFLRKFLAGISNIEELEVWELRLKLHEKLHNNWKNHGTEIIRELCNDGKPCLLLIDELSILLSKMVKKENGAIQALELLQWLRSLRQELAGRVSMVLGSSLGIGRVASDLKASHTLNDLRQVEVGPFDTETARKFVQALLSSQGLQLNEEAIEALLNQIGTYLPMFVQIMVSALANEMRSYKVKVTPELVKQCYEERVLGPEYRLTFEDYFERLYRYYSPDEARAAKRLLRELAIAKEEINYTDLYSVYVNELRRKAKPEDFDRLLTALQDDFYIKWDFNTKVQFHNKWLKDWWRRYHALGS